MIYKIFPSKHYDRQYKKLAKRNSNLNEKILNIIEQLQSNPFRANLRTHTVNSKLYKEAYSSRVTKDIRIIWVFNGESNGIMLLSIGGHSGSAKVYKSTISILP